MKSFESNFDDKLEETKKHLELKIEFSRQDAKDHLESVVTGINERFTGIDERFTVIDKRLGGIESRLGSVEAVALEINQEVKGISKKVGQHDQEIAALKEAVSA